MLRHSLYVIQNNTQYKMKVTHKHLTLKLKTILLLFMVLCYTNASATNNSLSYKLGGALRFGYKKASWNSEHNKNGGNFLYDVFRLNLDAKYKHLGLFLDYRFYSSASGGSMLKHGYMTYDLADKHTFQVGLIPVSHGIMPVGSNSFLLNMNYLFGLEDDADMGAGYVYDDGKWRIDATFFKNADWINSGEVSASRYGFDVGGTDKEENQMNVYLHRRWGNSVKQEVGVCGAYGGLHNIKENMMGSRYSYALHYTLDYNNWNLKAQFSHYNMRPYRKEGEPTNHIIMTGLGGSHKIASKADVYLASLSYKIPINKGIIDEICLFNDFNVIKKRIEGAKNSYQNILGMVITAGNIITYIDWAWAKNNPDFGKNSEEGFVKGSKNSKWDNLIYINFGYYF